VLQFLNTQSLLIAGLLVLGVACTSQPAPKPSAAPSVVAATAVSAETARRTDIQQSLSYTGDIRAREQIRSCPNRPDASSRCWSTLAIRSRPATAWPRVEDIAAGNAALAQQQTRLSKMRSGGRSEDILASEAGLTAAEAKLHMLMTALFDSPLYSLMILISLPLAVVGASGLLTLTGNTLNMDEPDWHGAADGAGWQECHLAGRLHQHPAKARPQSQRSVAPNRSHATAAHFDDHCGHGVRDDSTPR
jgi:hypothetical protein